MNSTSLMTGLAQAMAYWGDLGASLEIICRSIVESVPGIEYSSSFIKCNGNESRPAVCYPTACPECQTESALLSGICARSLASDALIDEQDGDSRFWAVRLPGHESSQVVLIVKGKDTAATESDVKSVLGTISSLAGIASRSLASIEEEMETRAYRRLTNMRAEMIAALSHEMRTPLAGIKGYVSSLLRDDVSWDEETKTEFLRIVSDESDRLEELISSILDMTAMESGNLPVEKSPVILQRLIVGLVSRIKVRTAKHSLTVNVDPSIPVIEVDPRRIEQVIYNLLDNAIKYSPYGGRITVTASRDGGQVLVKVSDEGVGIPEEHIGRLFDKFFRIGNSHRVRGVGLGLPIAKQIVMKHGGRIWAESQVGAGTTICFTIPIESSGVGQE